MRSFPSNMNAKSDNPGKTTKGMTQPLPRQQTDSAHYSLKKTSVVLDDHLEALTKKAAEAKQETMERSEKMRSAIEYYTLKWEEYKKKYESSELGQAYVTICREIEELEIKCNLNMNYFLIIYILIYLN